MNLARYRRADADLNHLVRHNEALLDGMVEDRGVSVSLPEIVGPGIDVRIEVNKRDRAAPFRQRAKERQRDAVVAAQRDEMLDLLRPLLDQRHAGDQVSEREREVADVGQWQLCRVDPMLRMFAVHQHPARLPHCAGSEPGAAAVGGAEVERNSGNADRRGGIAAAGAEECRRDRVGRHPGHGCVRGGAAKRNTAAATAQVQSPLAAPVAAAVTERLSTMRSLIS